MQADNLHAEARLEDGTLSLSNTRLRQTGSTYDVQGQCRLWPSTAALAPTGLTPTHVATGPRPLVRDNTPTSTATPPPLQPAVAAGDESPPSEAAELSRTQASPTSTPTGPGMYDLEASGEFYTSEAAGRDHEISAAPDEAAPSHSAPRSVAAERSQHTAQGSDVMQSPNASLPLSVPVPTEAAESAVELDIDFEVTAEDFEGGEKIGEGQEGNATGLWGVVSGPGAGKYKVVSGTRGDADPPEAAPTEPSVGLGAGTSAGPGANLSTSSSSKVAVHDLNLDGTTLMPTHIRYC